MKTRLFSVLALAVAMFAATSVSAQQEGNKAFREVRMEKGQKGNNAFAESMKLTDDQKTKIAELKLALKKDLIPLKNQLGEKKARLRTLETAEKPNLSDINKVIDEMGAIKADMAKKEAANKQEVRKVLTDKQRVAFDDRNGKMPGKMQKKMMKKQIKKGHPGNIQREEHIIIEQK